MLGRPNRVEPVLTNIFAGAWLKFSVKTDDTKLKSSTTPARNGRQSDRYRPLWPCRLNWRRVPRSLGTSLEKLSMKANLLPCRNESGIGLLLYSRSFGLYSKSSS